MFIMPWGRRLCLSALTYIFILCYIYNISSGIFLDSYVRDVALFLGIALQDYESCWKTTQLFIKVSDATNLRI